MFDFKENKKNIFLMLTILLIFFLLLIFNRGSDKNGLIELNVKDELLRVEIVSNEKDLERGLGGRDGLCLNCGMLFEFSQPGKYAFWMKGMRFPIDIIWIYEGEIVHLEKNVSPALVGTLNPAETADSVLEINAGKAEELGFEVGDKVSL